MHFRNSIFAVLGFAAFVACSDRAGITGPTNNTGVREVPTDGASLASTASIGVSLASPSIAVGKTTQANASVKDSAGNVISKSITWKSSNTAVATVSSTGLVTGVKVGSASITASTYSKSGSATVTVTAGTSPPPPSTKPGTVSNLSATAASASSATLAFTQVNDGAGAAAKYDVRVAKAPLSWGSASSVASGTCSTPLAGTATSGNLTCTVTGLSPSTAYNFQLVAYRGTMGQGATYGALSNVAAATTPASGSTPPPTPVATTVSVSPATASLAVSASQTLTATVKDQSGTPMSCSALAWSSANTVIATVSASGSVNAIAAGSATITATCASASGAATITVTSSTTPPPPVTPVVTTVSVSPSSASIVAGATQTLAANVRDQNGATMSGQTVTWATSNASVANVSNSGVVTAVAAGSATITATASGKSGNASITITAAPAPPPSGGSSPPSGMSLITQRGFSAMNESGWGDYINGQRLTSSLGSGNYTIVQDASAPSSASSVGQMRYPAGFSGGAGPGTVEKGIGSNNSVYISYWVKISSNWVGHGSGVNKQLFIWSDGKPTVYTSAQGSGSGCLQPQVRVQGTGGTGNYAPNLAPSTCFTRGVWHHWELVLTSNTSGASDGVAEWWIDGQKVGSYSNIRFNSGAATWNTLQWGPVWGGMGESVPADQFMWMDQINVSGK